MNFGIIIIVRLEKKSVLDLNEIKTPWSSLWIQKRTSPATGISGVHSCLAYLLVDNSSFCLIYTREFKGESFCSPRWDHSSILPCSFSPVWAISLFMKISVSIGQAEWEGPRPQPSRAWLFTCDVLPNKTKQKFVSWRSPSNREWKGLPMPWWSGFCHQQWWLVSFGGKLSLCLIWPLLISIFLFYYFPFPFYLMHACVSASVWQFMHSPSKALGLCTLPGYCKPKGTHIGVIPVLLKAQVSHLCVSSCVCYSCALERALSCSEFWTEES